MRICDNGVYRDATTEEAKAWETTPPPGSEEEIVTAEEIAEILLGEK